jgi:hypothetical protein
MDVISICRVEILHFVSSCYFANLKKFSHAIATWESGSRVVLIIVQINI